MKDSNLHICGFHDLTHFLFEVCKAIVIYRQAPILPEIATET